LKAHGRKKGLKKETKKGGVTTTESDMARTKD